jgi:hypothetical protein
VPKASILAKEALYETSVLRKSFATALHLAAP